MGLARSQRCLRKASDEETQGVTMIKKTIVVIAASALACALSVSAVSAKTTKHKAKPAKVAKVQPMKAVPGNNPFTIAPASAGIKNAPAPAAIKGNNPMSVAAK